MHHLVGNYRRKFTKSQNDFWMTLEAPCVSGARPENEAAGADLVLKREEVEHGSGLGVFLKRGGTPHW